MKSTQQSEYSERLAAQQLAWWKRVLDVQAPYRYNVRRLRLGFTLDVGCGIGRNLRHLCGHGVGVDHNAKSVEIARSYGLTAYTIEEFLDSRYARPHTFDSLLVAHVLEHMTEAQGRSLLQTYLPFVRPGGKVVLITPQEVGYDSDPTHVSFMDFGVLQGIARDAGLHVVQSYSFPFPRPVGRVFKYNEFVVVLQTAM